MYHLLGMSFLNSIDVQGVDRAWLQDSYEPAFIPLEHDLDTYTVATLAKHLSTQAIKNYAMHLQSRSDAEMMQPTNRQEWIAWIAWLRHLIINGLPAKRCDAIMSIASPERYKRQ